MAKGRIIVSAIAADKRVNALSDDTSRLAFTWLITFADRDGRTHGDPAMVRSMLFPRRSDVTVDQMARYISEWHAAGLVQWYEADGDKWIFFPSFHKHQTGFDKRHEPQSVIPTPPDVQTMPVTDAGNTTDVVRTTPVHCTSEVKRSEHEVNVNVNVKGLALAPSADLFKKLTGIDPTPAWASQMHRVVGTAATDLERWGTVVVAYTGTYTNHSNVKAMLEYYERNEVPGTKRSNGNDRPSQANNGLDRLSKRASEYKIVTEADLEAGRLEEEQDAARRAEGSRVPNLRI